MIVSLNEIEVNLRKAAIGAGLPLGLAEDLGRAGAWLAVFDSRVVRRCVDALDRLASGSVATPVFEESETGSWSGRPANDAPLSALFAGPGAGDLLVAETTEEALPATIRLAEVDSPLLVLAAVCDVMPTRSELKLAISFMSARGEIRLAEYSQGDVTFSSDLETLDSPCEMVFVLSQDSDGTERSRGKNFIECQQAAAEQGVAVEDPDWQRAQRLVAKTLVPASELSRLQGAGAGLRDND